MEVVNPNALQLSNFEVFNLLRQIKGQHKKNSQSQLATITYETTKYLEDKPCASQSEESVQQYLKAFLEHQIPLSKAEKLMFVNNPPTTPLEIQLVVEESEERLTDNQVESLVQITCEVFGEKPQENSN
ncbi:conserved hypothetical protein [Pediculus humanus corporis]|uniref:DNA-directed RNA polymerase III subunit RPC9 n=1 Tax=Pediculus humanus subsp. corporis TaxID=121224 RepID=E0VMU5_PEDHC|nr:uncharacterized protein Phum_PHUM319010 [Pediculus humanus corporis]EEB14701.1 conserved hypothetical protein [Pediculus humanus corporis]